MALIFYRGTFRLRPTDARAHLLNYLATMPTTRGGALPLSDLDSLGILQVVLYLETMYGIRLAGRQVEPQDLRTIDGLLSLIERYAS
jgi:hypothetical protein